MKNKTRLFFLSHCILFLSCSKEEKECNINIEIGNNISVCFYLQEFSKQTHANYPPDFAADISETNACDEFYLDSSRVTYLTICYEPILDSLYLDKSEIERLEGKLISSFMIGQNDTEILPTEISDKKSVYTVYIKIERNNFYHAALYKYSKNKLVFFQFHNFKNIEEIDQIVESIKFN